VAGFALFDLVAVVWTVRFREIWYFSQHYAKWANVADPELVWKHRPGLVWHGRKTPYCEPVDFRTDDNGFRNPRGISEADIVFIGDSVTEAGEVPEARTFVSETGKATGAQVLNLGVSGYGPQQELAVLKRYGLPRNPRLVVWQFTEWNDVIDAQTYAIRNDPSVPSGLTLKALYQGSSPLARLVRTVLPPRLPNTVAFLGSDGRTDRQAFWPYRHDHHKAHPRGFTETRKAIAEAHALCRERGVGFVVLYVPSHVRVLWPALSFKNLAQRDRFCQGGRLDRDDDLGHAVAALCHGLGCPIIDLTPALRRRAAADNRQVYVANDPHLGPSGHDEARRVLVTWLASQGWPGTAVEAPRVARRTGLE
jgi:hypothetical protein